MQTDQKLWDSCLLHHWPPLNIYQVNTPSPLSLTMPSSHDSWYYQIFFFCLVLNQPSIFCPLFSVLSLVARYMFWQPALIHKEIDKCNFEIYLCMKIPFYLFVCLFVKIVIFSTCCLCFPFSHPCEQPCPSEWTKEAKDVLVWSLSCLVNFTL